LIADPIVVVFVCFGVDVLAVVRLRANVLLK
jgi:hypothetical protein